MLTFTFNAISQSKILFVGNINSICLDFDSIKIIKENKLPINLSEFRSIFIFSGAESIFSGEDVIRLKEFIERGGGIYCGADNWPLQAESRQLTMAFYSKESWGNFEEKTGNIQTEKTTNQLFEKTNSFPSGSSTVSFPLDYRLKVEIWKEDQPLIQSGNFGLGKIIIDGGYSRFYCETVDIEKIKIFENMLLFLNN